MNASDVKSLVERELQCCEPFANYHGITSVNVRSFLVEPFTVWVDPDDLETQPRDMWVVLQETSSPYDGLVVYDPLDETWGIAELTAWDKYTLEHAGASSLAEILANM